MAYGPSYSVLKSTPEKQLAAWLFARWLLSPESQSRWVEATGLFPLRIPPGDIGPYRAASPQWQAAVGYLSLAQGVPQLASWRKVRYVLEDGDDTFPDEPAGGQTPVRPGTDGFHGAGIKIISLKAER